MSSPLNARKLSSSSSDDENLFNSVIKKDGWIKKAKTVSAAKKAWKTVGAKCKFGMAQTTDTFDYLRVGEDLSDESPPLRVSFVKKFESKPTE